MLDIESYDVRPLARLLKGIAFQQVSHPPFSARNPNLIVLDSRSIEGRSHPIHSWISFPSREHSSDGRSVDTFKFDGLPSVPKLINPVDMPPRGRSHSDPTQPSHTCRKRCSTNSPSSLARSCVDDEEGVQPDLAIRSTTARRLLREEGPPRIVYPATTTTMTTRMARTGFPLKKTLTMMTQRRSLSRSTSPT